MDIEQTHELLPLTSDYVFRRIFGEKNKEALADFLSAVLDMPLEDFSDLEIDDPHIHRDRKDGKSAELDLRARKKSGEIFNIEIQLDPVNAFKERAAYYNSRIYAGQLDIGKGYGRLNRTISVIITNFVLIEENEDCFNRFRWYNISNGTQLTDAQEINVLELKKLPEKSDGTRLWRWLKLLALRREDEMEDVAKDNTEMKKVVVTLREMSQDEAERRFAEAEMKQKLDELGRLQYAEEAGMKKGLAEAKYESARRMLEKGYSISEIQDISGLGAEEINRL